MSGSENEVVWNEFALPLARVGAPVGPLLLINLDPGLNKRTSHHD